MLSNVNTTTVLFTPAIRTSRTLPGALQLQSWLNNSVCSIHSNAVVLHEAFLDRHHHTDIMHSDTDKLLP